MRFQRAWICCLGWWRGHYPMPPLGGCAPARSLASPGLNESEPGLSKNKMSDHTAMAAAAGPELDAGVVAEQIRLLVDKRVDLPINLLVGCIVATILWSLYPAWLLVAWLVSFCIVLLVRFLVRRRYKIATPSAEMARHWGRIFTASTFATACLWGLSGSVILVTPNPLYHNFIVFLLGGIMAGGIVSNSAYMPAMLAYMLPTIMPVIAALLTRHNPIQIEMGVILTIFAGVMIAAGRKINLSITENVRLRIGQDGLLVKLRASEAAMAADVAERKRTESKLHLANSLLDAEAEASPDGIVVVDQHRRIISFNRRFAEIWQIPLADLTAGHAGRVLAKLTSAVKNPAEFNARVVHLYSHPEESSHDEYETVDGRFVERYTVSLKASTGDYLGRVWYFRDITERQATINALAYRDSLLRAVTDGTGVLLGSESLAQSMPEALRIVGEAIQVDRVFVMQEVSGHLSSVALRYHWEAPDIQAPLGDLRLPTNPIDTAELVAWITPLSAGKPVINQLADSEGLVRRVLERYQNQSALLVPIILDDKLWGILCVGACKTQREWVASEIDTMKIFADIAGALIRRNETQALLASSRERFRVLTATANDAIVTMDGGGLITHWNRAAERIFGYTESETVGRQVHEFLVPTRFQERAALGLKAFATSGKGGSLGKTVEMAAIRKDGIEIAIEISLAGTQLGGQWQAIAIMRDITERKQATAYALRMARYDVLTGLANRAVFVEDLQNAIAVAKRSGGGVAVIYLDLDHFKDINDTLGHPAGDELLKAVAARLRANTRETDTVARFGGDEFAVVVADTADPADAALLADKIIKAIADPFSVHGRDIHSGGSVGIAAYGADASDAETLLSHADVALYRAKSEGRGAYRFYNDAMDYEVQTRVKLGAELRTAIESDQLFLMYQPQISIDSGQITGVEALVRWRHPERGVLGADVFVPIAEEIGCIARLGRWVLWAACRQAKEWLDAGIAPKRVSVNVSALQFKTPGALADDIAEALAETGVPPTLLELELTESVLAYASREHGDALQRLRSTGITIAIDDFGTGYSSLEYLSRSPSNRIKIAQAFVKNLDTKTGDAAIVRATIALAHELGLNIVAEGVETAAQADLLRGWGCGEAQGFHFARPLSGEDATALLRTADLSAVSRLRLAQARATAATSHSHGRRRGFRKQHLPTRCAELAAVID